MNRRFVNLAMTDDMNHVFSLHRMDLAKLLFYPSTAEAETSGGKGRPPKLGKLRLPPPIMAFKPFPTSSDPFLRPDRSMFALLHGSRGGEPSRILFAGSDGLAAMYDVDLCSIIPVPDPSVHTTHDDTPIVTGAGAGEERLYVVRPSGRYVGPFEVLDFSVGDKRWFNRRCSSLPWKWKSLPPVPEAVTGIGSTTVVDGGRIICVSTRTKLGGAAATFCFDTASQEWWKAGDWVLPFRGRAEHVPELDMWLGFSRDHPHHLCVADLSGVAMAPRRAPAPRHIWEDYEPPPGEETSLVLNKDYPDIALTKSVYWSVIMLFLVNLGSGRFCVAKVVDGEESKSLTWSMAETVQKQIGTFTVLTGVEVIRGGGDGDELRMVKHKSRRLVHLGLDVACVL